MPRYFFDVRDGDHYSRDERGINLPDVSKVWEVAVPMVDEIALAKQQLHPPCTVSVLVRDAEDRVVYRSDHVGRSEEPAGECATAWPSGRQRGPCPR